MNKSPNRTVCCIIPCYNSAKYITRAVNSVLKQTYKDWKLILVNDASTDNTLEVLNNLASKCDKIEVVDIKENGGAGKARIEGNNHIGTCGFVTYLDSDDVWKPDFLEMSMMLQAQHDSDAVYTSFTIRWDQPNGKPPIYKTIPAGDYIMSEDATVQLHYSNGLKFLTGKIFKAELVRKGVWSKKRIGEDVNTLYSMLYYADRVRSSSYSGYIHIFRKGSLLADKPQFYCWCESMIAGFDIIQFLTGRGEKRQRNFLLCGSYNDYVKFKNDIESGAFKLVKREDYYLYINNWKKVDSWFKENKDLVNLMLAAASRGEIK